MLQRIQSLFLLLIILAMLTLFFVPIWSKIDVDAGHSFTLHAWHMKAIAADQVDLIQKPYITLGILGIVVAMLALYAVLCYKDRIRQLHVCAFNSLLLTGMMGCVVYWVVKHEAKLSPAIKGHYQIGFIAIVIAVISNLLANQFIKRDENLVRAADQIR